jgi:hypothetical protein
MIDHAIQPARRPAPPPPARKFTIGPWTAVLIVWIAYWIAIELAQVVGLWIRQALSG